MVPVKRRTFRAAPGVGIPDIQPRGNVNGSNFQSVLAQPNVPSGVIPGGSTASTGSIPSFSPIGLMTSGGPATAGGFPGTSGIYKPTFKVLTLNLANANNLTLFTMSGNTLWYMDSTNSTDRLFITIDQQANDPLPFGPGAAIQGVNFAQFWITNAIILGATAYLVVINDPNLNVELLDTRP